MSRRRLGAAVLALLIASWGLPSARAAGPFRYPEKSHGKGTLKYVNDIPVLTVEGTPQEIGEQVAVLGVKPATRLARYPMDYLRAFNLQFVWPWFVSQGKKILEHFPADHRAELDAIIKASGLDGDYLVAANTMFDIKKLFACSALIVEADRSTTGGPLFGRNLDYPSLGYVQEYSLVTIYRPRGKHAFASVGFPGLVGCLSGMNDAGLSLAVLEVFAVKNGAEKYDDAGTPYGLCYRRILEECTTIDEAEKLLKSMKRITTTNLAICDKNGGAVFEVTARHVLRRKSEDKICACTNHFLTDDLRPDRQENFYKTLDRYKILAGTRDRKEKFAIADLHKSLHAVSQGTATLQTMIFEPATLRLYLAIGQCPSSKLPLKVVELGPYLKRDSAGK